MCERETRNGCVTVSVQLPRHLADLLVEHRSDFVAIIELLGRECQHLPPTAEVQAEADRLSEQKEQERQDRNTKFGRAGYRLYRRRIQTDGYQKTDGEYRDRPARLSKAQWRRLVILDIAVEFDISEILTDLCISKFRKDLDAKIKPRRNQAIFKLFNEGLSEKEIASRTGVSVTTIIRYRKANLGELQRLPGLHNSLKTKKRGTLLGTLPEHYQGDSR